MAVGCAGGQLNYTCSTDGNKYFYLNGNQGITCRIINATGVPVTGLYFGPLNSQHPYSAFPRDFRLCTNVAADCTAGNAPFLPAYVRFPSSAPGSLTVGQSFSFGYTCVAVHHAPLAAGTVTSSLELPIDFICYYTVGGVAKSKRFTAFVDLNCSMHSTSGTYFTKSPSEMTFTLNPASTPVGDINVRAIAGSSVVVTIDNGTTETVVIDEISDGAEINWHTAAPLTYQGQIVEVRVTGRTAHVEQIENDPDTGFLIDYFDPSFDTDGDGDDDGAGQPLTAETPGSPPGADPGIAKDVVDAAEKVPTKDFTQPHSSKDNTANTTKKDEYWAVRDAVEDAIGGGMNAGTIAEALGPGGLGDAGSGELELGETGLGEAGTGEGNGIAAGFGSMAESTGSAADSFGTGPGTEDEELGLPEFGSTDTYTLPLGPLGSATLNAHDFDPYRGYLRRVFELIIWIQTTLHFLSIGRATANAQ